MKKYSESVFEENSRSSFRSQSFVVHSEIKGIHADTPQDLQLPNIDFLDESSFMKEPQCFICKMPFGQLNRQHHCRICGHSCCNLCSARTINKQRSCDICFLKATSVSFQKRRAKCLEQMKGQIKQLKRHIVNAEGRLKQLNDDMVNQQNGHSEEMIKVKAETQQYQIKYSQLAQERQMLLEDIEKLKEQLKQAIAEKEQLSIKAQNTQNQIRGQDTDIYLSEQKYNELKAQLIYLLKQKEDLLNYKEEEPLKVSAQQTIIQEESITIQTGVAPVYNDMGNDLIDSMMGVAEKSPGKKPLKKQQQVPEEKEVKGCSGCLIQ